MVAIMVTMATATAVVTMAMVVHLVVLVAEAASMAEVKTAFVAVVVVTDQTMSIVVFMAPAMFDPKSVAIERLADLTRLITVPNPVPMAESKIMSMSMMLEPAISLAPTVAAITATLPFFFRLAIAFVFAIRTISSDYSIMP